MKNISVSVLKPNSFFEKPVFIDKGYILLSPEVPVTIELIRRLNDWNYYQLFSESDQVTISATAPDLSAAITPNQGNLDKIITDTKSDDVTTNFYTGLLNYFDAVFTNFNVIGEIDLEKLTNKIKELIEMQKNYKNNLISIIMQKKSYENYLPSHCLNSTIICLCIAEVLKFPSHKTIELGIAAILHEIGMLKLPIKIYLSHSSLAPQDRKTISAHTVLGYKILKGLSVNDDIAICAMEHHERVDGSGYPRGLKGNTISLYSRIIAIACSFEGAVSLRPYKKSLDGHKAIIDLLVTKKQQFDENILKALVLSISIFPPGTYVQLNNNTKGIVCKANPANPKFPVVRILVNEYGEKLPVALEVETSLEKGIAINHVLTEEEIAKLPLNP